MKRKTRDFSFDVKDVKSSGEFEGHASVFDAIDFYREVVMPGAFMDSIAEWKSKAKLPPVLWQHLRHEPIGPLVEMREDDVGLFIRGQLLVDDVARAREARALMKSGAITGLSFGFDVDDEEYDSRAGILKLKKIDVWEVSVVTFPANEAAAVEGVKDAFSGHLPTVREFEEFLRDAGFSRAHSKAIASHGLSRLLREAESPGAKDAPIADLDAAIARLLQTKPGGLPSCLPKQNLRESSAV